MKAPKLPLSGLKKLAAYSVVTVLFMLASASASLGVTVTSTGSGNWNSTTPDAPWPGGLIPTAGDDVIIAPGHNITVTTNTIINSITFNNTAATARTLTVNSGVILNVMGAAGITLENAGGATNTNATIAGSGTISCAVVTVGGTTPTITADATTTLTSTISALSMTGNLNLNGEDEGNDDNDPTFNLQSGTVTVGGTVNTDEEAGSTVTLSLNTGAQSGTLSLSGATPFTDAVGTLTLNAAGTTATVNYSGASQTIRSTTYTNITLSGSGTKTTTSTFTTNDNFIVGSGVTLDVAGFTFNLNSAVLTVNGTVDFTNAGGSFTSNAATSTLTMGSGGLLRTIDANGLGPAANASLIATAAFTTSSIDTSGTVEYYRTGDNTGIITDRNYNNLTITNTGTKTLTQTASRTVNGNVTINASAPFTLNGAFALNVKGNWANNGSFTHGAGGSVAFNGATNQTIGGTSANTFQTLTIANTGTGDEVVSLTSAALTTVSTALNVNDGIFDQGASSNLTTNTVTIAAAGTLRNLGTGDLALSGNVSNAGTIRYSANGSPCGDADSIAITSTSGTRTWSGAGTFSFSDVDVSGQAAGVPPTTITVQSGTDNNADASWVFVGCLSNTYTWNPVVAASWIVATNWTPTRTTPNINDVLIFDGTATPAPIVTNVPTEEIAALRMINGADPNLQAGAANNTLTISGRTGTDLSVPSGSVLTLSTANALRLLITSGSTADINSQIIFQDGAHRLLGNAASAILFHSTADFTTTTGFTGNAFGSGGGAGNGVTSSVQFESGSQYFHGAGDSPFGSAASAAVAVFQTGSEADWLANTGFQGSGRTYANLVIGNSGTEVDVSDTGGSGDFQFNNLVVNSTGSQDSSLTFSSSGTVTIKGNITSAGTGINGTIADVSLTAGSGGIQINVGGTATFGNIGNSRSIFFGSNATVVSGTTLNLSRLVQMGLSADGVVTDSGTIVPNFASVPGYIVGAVRRPVVPSSYIFAIGKTTGYTPVTLSSATGMADMTIRPRDGTIVPVDDATSLDEYWTITLNSGSLTSDLQFTYLDADVDGTEANYKVIRVEHGAAYNFTPTNLNTAANTASVTGVISHFSDWTLGEAVGATAVKFGRFNAASFADGVQLTWDSGFEVDNLGYHVYRERNGKRTRVTPSIVAGSALRVGKGNAMTAGYSYAWFDAQGTPDTVYHLEAIDLDGSRQWAGPVHPYAGQSGKPSPRRRAKLLNDLMTSSNARNSTLVKSWPAEMKAADAADMATSDSSLAVQQAIAAGQAVKIQVRASGWYRVTQADLVAAGFDPNTDARTLQLFVDGSEVPISLSTAGARLNNNDTLEFYGVPLDTPTTDARVYWLIDGSSAGKRMIARRGKLKAFPDEADPSLSSFPVTVERRDQIVYFPNLLNGDQDNLFGAPIFSDPIEQTIAVHNLSVQSASQPQLEIALQGLTDGGHQVNVKLNGTDIGTMNLAGNGHAVETFAVDPTLLHEGDNVITLASMNGDSDISLVDTIRLTYAHQHKAINNSLRFTAPAGHVVQIDGFNVPNIRVVDITDPNAPVQLSAMAAVADGGYSVKIQTTGSGARTLLAFTEDQSGHPASITPNQPSTWNAATNSADMVVITHRDFRNAIEPLANLRRSQGLNVAVVDVEDVYDEFSYGAHTPAALKSFLLNAATDWQRKPQYLLLVGDSSWDPRDYLGEGANDFVPTKLIDTSSMETASDDWLADFEGFGLTNMAVGRLPGRTAGEVSLMVSKIMSYEQERELNSPLRGALMVADNGFESQSSQTGSLLPAGVDVQNINRSQVGNDDVMRGQILDALNQGPMIVNYYGHGSVTVWTGAGLLDSDLVSGLTNANRPSVYVMMTCLNGYASDAYIDSLGEASLKAQNGAVAVWASSGFTLPQPQFAMNSEFYRLLFGTQPIRLGEAMRSAKVATSDLDVRRTWTLLGDPAMRIR